MFKENQEFSISLNVVFMSNFTFCHIIYSLPSTYDYFAFYFKSNALFLKFLENRTNMVSATWQLSCVWCHIKVKLLYQGCNVSIF